jgi:hypothetical protein
MQIYLRAKSGRDGTNFSLVVLRLSYIGACNLTALKEASCCSTGP